MNLHGLFFPSRPPNENELKSGQRCIVAEGAVAAVIYTAGTGNFMAGYLSELGASIALCAAVAMIPQFGCVLQLFSPFLFERLHYRKLVIWLLCVVFRVSLALAFFVPLFLGSGAAGLGTVLVLYVLAFFAAGIVTPGLQHMVLGLAPQEHRGSFFAGKDIVATCINGAAVLALGRQLDYFTKEETPYTGFLVLGGVCLALAILDAVLLARVHEVPVAFASRMRVTDILQPLRDDKYKPLLRYTVISGLMSGLSAPFLSVYQLRVLGLSHTFITTAGLAAAAAGILGSWFWGRYADHTTWARLLRLTVGFSLLCTLGWGLIQPAYAPVAAPVLMICTAACAGCAGIASMNLQFISSPERGKTAYIGVTSAMASIAACLSAAAGTAMEPLLEIALGEKAIPLLFLAAGGGGLLNLAVNGSRLPDCS